MSPTIITKPKIEIAPELLAMTKTLSQVESQVVVHCLVAAPWYSEIGVRIWPTTFLFDHHSSHESELVHFENITPYPDWTMIAAGSSSFFTLFFTGLPKACTVFDLKEQIPELEGFEVLSISRNETDVYYVKF